MGKKLALALTVSGGLFGVSAAQASAATVSVATTHRVDFIDASTPGENNNVTITASSGSVTFVDTGAPPLTAGPGCTSVDENTAQCTGAAITHLSLHLGGGDDVAHNNSGLRASIYGSDGDDQLFGGSAGDTLIGGPGRDTITAGDGNDTIYVAGGAVDAVHCGGGIDTVHYDNYDSLDNSCEVDGNTPPPPPPPTSSGEAPPPSHSGPAPVPVIKPSPPGTKSPMPVKKGRCPTLFMGTRHADRIEGTGSGDRLFGKGGNDVLNALGGADCLYGMAGNDSLYAGAGTDWLYGASGRDRLYGGPGRDRLWGGPGKDRLWGGPGKDRLNGGKGNDRLRGGGGHNTYLAGPGKDRIYAVNGKVDKVNCGSGRDVARVDRRDHVKHCERVIRK